MAIKIGASELFMATKVASNDQTRMVICSVLVKCKDGMYYIVATDSYRIVELSGEYEQEHENVFEEINALIPVKTIKDNVKCSDSFVMISQDGENVKLEVFDKKNQKRCEVVTRQTPGNYPDYERLFSEYKNNDMCNTLAFNATYLSDMCDIVKKAYGKKDCVISVEFTGNMKPALFYAKKYDVDKRDIIKKFRGLLMPVRV